MDHLTPDVLAAWMEGTLSPAERSAAEAHASDCAHCQAMLAAMARTAPPVAARGWWNAASVRWLVPIAAAAIVVATWVGIDRGRHDAVPAVNVTLTSARQSAPPASAPEPAREEAQPSADVTAQPEAKSDNTKTAANNAKDAASGDRKKSEPIDALQQQKRADGIAANAPRAESPAAAPGPPAPQAFGAVAQSAAPANAAAGPPPPASAPAPARPATPPQPAESLDKVQALQEKVTITSETPLVAADSARAAVAKLPPVEVMSPERSYRWRAVAPGSIQYSVDGGLNWQSSATGTSVALRAGSAPSRTVCWLVGQAGLVLLTTDGRNWQVRPFPERIDLTDVSATDARTATVTTANRRRFATADGGATWSPLQEN